jgi:hypothetical protein
MICGLQNSETTNSGILEAVQLRQLFREIAGVVGTPLSIELEAELEAQGIVLSDSNNFYTISEVEEAFRNAFGSDTADLLMRQIKKRLLVRQYYDLLTQLLR